jgi:D-alanyl-D-alanine carboxypeptidase (penicillin-binding protein 5/6)
MKLAMTNEPLFTNPTTTPRRNRFPIVAQLVVLGVVMLLIYGSWLTQNLTPSSTSEVTNTEILLDDNKYPLVPQEIEEVSLEASAAYVWDVTQQRALYAKNESTALPMASITKLMTSLLAYELVAGDETLAVSLEAVRQEGNSGLSDGETLQLEALSKLALVSSSNDAAYALGANVGALLGGNDPEQQFVLGMNIKADELGLNTLDFYNTTGLDESTTVPGGIGSAQDVTFLMEHIITTYPELLVPTKTEAQLVYNTSRAYHIAQNTNEVVLDIPNILGSKTGYTDLAGGNLTVAFDAGLNRPIIITVLGSTREARFTDVMTLVQAVQDSFSQPQ